MREYRYPTQCLWGTNYENGYRLLKAKNAHEAMSIIPKGIGIERVNLQVKLGNTWRFATVVKEMLGGFAPNL